MRLLSLIPFVLQPSISTASNFVSPSNQVEHMGMGSIVAICTGSPSGTLKLQGSHDNVNFADIGSSLVISASGVYMLRLSSIEFTYLQGVWTGSGTGTMILTLQAKGF